LDCGAHLPREGGVGGAVPWVAGVVSKGEVWARGRRPFSLAPRPAFFCTHRARFLSARTSTPPPSTPHRHHHTHTMSSRQPSAAITGGATADEEDFDLANASDDGGESGDPSGGATPAAYDSAEEDAIAEVCERGDGGRVCVTLGGQGGAGSGVLGGQDRARRGGGGFKHPLDASAPVRRARGLPSLSRPPPLPLPHPAQANLNNSSLVEIRRREKQRIRAAAKARAEALKSLKAEEDREFASKQVRERGVGEGEGRLCPRRARTLGPGPGLGGRWGLGAAKARAGLCALVLCTSPRNKRERCAGAGVVPSSIDALPLTPHPKPPPSLPPFHTHTHTHTGRPRQDSHGVPDEAGRHLQGERERREEMR
jgi:hypothetical protein